MLYAAALAALATGCDDLTISSQPQTPPKKVVKKKVLVPKPKPPPKIDTSEELAVIDQAFRDSHRQASFSSNPEEAAVRRVGAELEKFVEVGPTLVVWLIDRTSSSFSLATAAIGGAKQFYQSEPVKEWSAGGEQKLLTAVAALDDKVELLIDPPTGDPQAIRNALDKITQSRSGKELTFAAVKQLLERYEKLRAQQRQLVIVLVSDEAGDDDEGADDVVARLQKQAIPVYAIGYPAPWGQENPFQKSAQRGVKNAGGEEGPDAWPRHGPESHASERVHLPLPTAGFGFRSAEMDDLVDSGFGPLGIERMCRAGGGAFLAVRKSGGSFVGFGGTRTWPTGGEAGFEEGVASRYAPDYVSAAEYDKLLSASKARRALVEAAKVGRADVLDNPNTSFPKAANEAQMKRQLDEAQQMSARVAPQLDRLYETLLAGEADREQLAGRRWQAQFDYALGRVLAAKTRNDGYNQMIAALKAGKGPKDVATYVLEPADSYETSSALKKMAEKSRMYLERVVKEHPGTPWAKFAEEDLKAPMGWKWQGT
jgi:von Willebrand factor type A domain-containing protein